MNVWDPSMASPAVDERAAMAINPSRVSPEGAFFPPAEAEAAAVGAAAARAAAEAAETAAVGWGVAAVAPAATVETGVRTACSGARPCR